MKIFTQSTTTFSGNSFTSFIAFVLLLLSSVSFGQSNPAAFALSGGNFSFTTQTATNTAYPTNIQGWTTGTNNIATLTTAAPGADQTLVASGTATTSGLSNLGANGFNLLSTGSSPNQQVGAIVVAVNATGRANLTATWTAADQTSGATRQMNLTLQYRLGTSGTFTTVASSTYTTSNSSQLAAQTFTNIALPSAVNGQAVVQLRWISYESAAQSGGRDAIRLDDITIASSAAAAVDGVISTNEYGTHTNGANQQSSATGTWYMNWDANNLYVGVTGGNTAEGAIMYLDKNPLALVNGGTNADGNLVGQNYDGSGFANLQFRADLVVYFKNGYDEFRTADGLGAWSAPNTSATAAVAGTTREISIPWSAIGGMPAAFNWFGYIAYTGGGAYASVPTENPGSGAGTIIGSTARWDRYYTVSTTTVGSATPPFSRNSYTFTSASDVTGFGAISAYDFTMNSSGRFVSRTGNVTGNWVIGGNLTVGAGTIYLGSGGSGYGTTAIAGNLNLLGGTYDMDATTASTTVTGNVSIASGATLKMSTQVGGDIYLAGNWSNLGTFTPSSRLITFNGAAAQTLTGATTFDYLTLNNSLGLTLQSTTSSIVVNQPLLLTSGKLTLGANNLTAAGSITSSPTNYVVTNGTGQLKRTVGAGAVTFPVGNSAYNPIIFNNTGGTSDVYGVNVLDGTYATPYDATKVVNRRWQVTEAVTGGSNLSVVGQYNTADTFGANFAAGTTPLIGFYNGTSWTTVGANAAGTNPVTYTSTANITPSDLTSGTQYIGLGKDNAFVSTATKLVITAITPSTPSATDAFTVTVQAQDIYNLPANVVAGTSFDLTTNGNAGALGGTTSGTILAGTNSIVVTGVTLATAGTGVTLTATRTTGDTLTAGTSSTFTVLAAPTYIAFVGVPGTGSAGVNLASFTVEVRRADNSVDTNYVGNVVITKASGPGVLSGTTTVAVVSGVATFNAAQLDLAGTYTLNANAGSFSQITSGNIVISLVPASIFANPITGTNPGSVNPYTTGQSFNSNITVTGIGAGTGVTNSSANDRFTFSGWNSVALDANDYFTFTLTPNAGYAINFENLAYTSQASGTGPATFAFRSSLDSFGANITAPTNVGGTQSLTATTYDNITSAITFRIYGWGASAAAGTYSINDFIFNGNVVCIQPTAYAVTGGGSYCTGGAGIAVGLANSQSNISYQLKIGGVNTGSPVAGTGSAITFGLQTVAGTYTVEATNANSPCNYSTTMTGNAVVATYSPATASVISGTATICSGASTDLQVTITGGTSPYTVVYSDGTLNSYTSGSNIPVSPSSTTTYTLTSVTDANGCTGTGNSGSAVVTVNSRPTASVISGSASICLGSSTNLQVSITGGTTPYTVVYTGGTIPSYTSGTNIPVSPTTTTTYTLTSVTDANGCAGIGNSGSAVVTLTTTTSTDGGVTWDNGTPTNVKSIVFNGGSGTLSSDIFGCSLHLTNNAAVIVASGKNVTLSGAVTVDSGSTFTLNNNANLLQGGTTNTNTGSITVKRESAAIRRLDYTLWSSPVVGQGLYAFSRFTLPNRFYVYDSTTDAYSNSVGFDLINLQYPSPLVFPNGVDGTDQANVPFVTGKGYLIRVPWNHPTSPAVYDGAFTGVPNNGNISISSFTSGQYFATGNPYPSTIDADVFITDNNIGDDPQTPGDGLYFWRKTNNASSASYATYTTAGGVASGGDTLNIIPNGVIQVGEGFIVKTTSGSLVFNNLQRIANNDNQFLRTSNATASTNTIERNRIWLNLADNGAVVNQMMVAYMTGATQNIDAAIDGRYFNDSPTALNSLIGNGEFAIQGRSLPFEATDVVPLAFKAAASGNYSIAIDHVDGMFTGGTQAIYVKDNLTNTEHNLQTGAYAFASEAGTFNNRFEIIFQSQLAVENPTFNANNVIIYRQNNDFVINSGTVMMASVKVFDIRGRLLQERKDINASQTVINGGLANEVLLVQIVSEDGIVVTKKVIR